MSVFPARADGVVDASFGDGAVAYDLVTETRYTLDAVAATVLDACDGLTDRDGAIHSWASTSGADANLVAARVDDALERFAQVGLVGRDAAWVPPSQRRAASTDTSADQHVSHPHPVLDFAVRFRSTDPGLLEAIDDYLGTASSGTVTSGVEPSTLYFDVEWVDDVMVDLTTDETMRHADLGTLLGHLVTVTTDYASQTNGCAALHAGGVRTPGGHVVALPAVSEAGKSTLTAALVQAGADYLGDETVGVTTEGTALGFAKRPRLGPLSCQLLDVDHNPRGAIDVTELRADVQRLGGPVGPIDAVVFPAYSSGAEIDLAPLDPHECLDELLANTLNLARVGQPGLDALCRVAQSAAAYRLVHGDAREAARTIIDQVD